MYVRRCFKLGEDNTNKNYNLNKFAYPALSVGHMYKNKISTTKQLNILSRAKARLMAYHKIKIALFSLMIETCASDFNNGDTLVTLWLPLKHLLSLFKVIWA